MKRSFSSYPKFYKLDTSEASRRFVITDIHGCSQTLHKLLDQIQLQKSDYLFFLGDYIDRGMDSKGVLDTILNLQKNNYHIFPLRGNHEDEFIWSIENEEDVLAQHHGNQLETLLDENHQVKKVYQDFLFQLPFYYELEDYYLVHAGFNFSIPNPFENFEEMLWIRDFPIDKHQLNGKRIIHGHTPTALDMIQESISCRTQVINIDGGAVFYDFTDKGYGNLVALNIDTFELYTQHNLEQQRYY